MTGVARALREWTPDSRFEPVVRIGIVLPEDGLQAIRVEMPDGDYRVVADAGAVLSTRPLSAEVAVAGERVALRRAHGEIGPAAALVVVPEAAEEAAAQGAGIRLCGLIAGRGFHWQRRIDATFTGQLEFRCLAGRLLVVNHLPLEQYLAGVISAEMSGECPVEFLKSQCVVARGWLLARTEQKHPGLPIDRCNDDCCQRYQGTGAITPAVLEAVRATRGQVLAGDGGTIIDANYSKSCGGIIEAPEHVWGVSKQGQRAAVDAPAGSQAHRFFPLREEDLDEFLGGAWLSRTDLFCSPNTVPENDLPRYLGRVDDGGGHFRWRIEYGCEELEAILRLKLGRRGDESAPRQDERLHDLRVLRRGQSGRATILWLEYRDRCGGPRSVTIASEYAIRDALHAKFLYSSAFRIELERDASGDPARIALSGAGWGHGAGLCQIGALGMALAGHRCEEILGHYFAGVSLARLYE